MRHCRQARREAEEQVAFLVPPLTAFTAGPDDSGSWSGSVGWTRAPHPIPVSQTLISCGQGAAMPQAAGTTAAAEDRATWTDAHARSSRSPRPQQPAPPTARAPNAREKSKQRRIGFCSIRGAGGGKSMFSKWEKRKSFRKDSLFPSRRGVRKHHRPLRRKHRGP